MAQSLARLLVHLIYSTKHRAKVLPHQPYKELHAFCSGVLKNHGQPSGKERSDARLGCG